MYLFIWFKEKTKIFVDLQTSWIKSDKLCDTYSIPNRFNYRKLSLSYLATLQNLRTNYALISRRIRYGLIGYHYCRMVHISITCSHNYRKYLITLSHWLIILSRSIHHVAVKWAKWKKIRKRKRSHFKFSSNNSHFLSRPHYHPSFIIIRSLVIRFVLNSLALALVVVVISALSSTHLSSGYLLFSLLVSFTLLV